MTLSKNTTKLITALAHKKYRDESGLFVAEGTKLVLDLLEGGLHCHLLAATPEWLAAHPAPPADEVAEATEWFERILADLAPYAGTIDLAFFPLDPRMGRDTARGAWRFLSVMRPKRLVPMHFQGDDALVRAFAAQNAGVAALTERGQALEF